jgi:hypothetical protein
LIAYHDCELTGRKAKRIADHLAGCARCRREYERIGVEAAVLASSEPDLAGFDLERGLGELLSAIASREEARRSQPPAASQLRDRLRAQLWIYFGSKTAMLADAQSCDERELLSRAECLLSTFLGRANAVFVMEQILEGPECRPAASEGW